MRPATFQEARAGMQPFFVRLLIAYLIVGGIGSGLIYLTHESPKWLFVDPGVLKEMPPAAADAVKTAVVIVGLLITIAVFVVWMLALLLAPILVVEEGSVGDAFREWRALVREHRMRVFLYEGLAIGLGLVTMLPLAIPVFAGLYVGPGVADNMVGVGTRAALWGLVAGPLIAFLAVANVFVYLNLRYEYTPAK